jgi:NTE family protein
VRSGRNHPAEKAALCHDENNQSSPAGGGAHGGFTWGALDRLLEEKRIEIEEISATSAGAMNAAVLAYGFATGGRDGARAALAADIRSISIR